MGDSTQRMPMVRGAIFYNVLEAIFSILFGIISGSIALIGYGLQSIAETLFGWVLIWHGHRFEELPLEEAERLMHKLSSFCAVLFFIFGSYVFISAVTKLMLQEAPHPTLAGMIIAAISLVMMPLFTFWSYKKGENIQGTFFTTGFKDIWGYMFLSLALLIGLGLNFFYGIWQADPVIGLISVLFLYKRSLEGFLGGF